MDRTPPTLNETRRLDALRRYGVLDTQPEGGLDDITHLASTICGCPFAAIALVDEQRIWFKSRVGWELAEVSRESLPCGSERPSREFQIFADLTQDVLFSGSPVVSGVPHIRFYAEAPLMTSGGFVVGALFVADHTARTLTEVQAQTLRVLGPQAMAQLELQRQQRELQTSEAGRHTILKTALDGILVIDHEGRIVEFNPAAERIFDCPRSEVLGQPVAEIIVPPETRPQYREHLARYLQREAAEEPEHRIQLNALRADGGEFPVELSILPIPRTTPALYNVQIRDLSERQRAETALEASEGRLRAIFEAEPECVKLLGPEATLVKINGAGLRLIEGDNFESVAGKSLLPLVVPEEREYVRAMLQAVEAGEKRTWQCQIVGMKGTRRWLELTAVPFPDGGLEQNLVLAISRDITAAKAAEEKLRRLNHLYAVSSGINEAIVHFRDPQELYEQACRIAVERGGLVMAWVGLAEAGRGEFHPVARWGRDEGFLDSVEFYVTADRPAGRGPAGLAFRTGAVALSNDIENNPDNFPYPREALQRGYRSCAAFPLKLENHPTGVLVVYGDHPNYFDREEIALLQALAENISFAVESHYRDLRRLEAEEASSESERRYRDIVEVSPDAIFTHWNNRIEFINSAGLRLLKSSDAAEVLGRAPMDFFAPEYHPAIRKRIARLLKEPCANSLIGMKMVALDGTVLDVEVVAASFLSGGEIHIQVFCRDVTERHQAEEKARRTTDLLRAVAEGASDAIFVKDLQGRYLLFNQSASDFVGRPIEEVLGKDDTALFGPDDARRLMDRDRVVMVSGERRTSEEVLTAGGRTRTYLATKAPYRDHQGKIVGLVGISRDITERKEAERALRSSEARFASIFHANPAAISINTIDTGRVIDVNHRICEFYGWDRDEIIGKTVFDLKVWVDPAQRIPLIEQVRATGSVHQAEARFRRKNGEVRDVLLSMELIKIEGESEPVLITMFTDHTDRKRAESQLRLLETCVARLNDIVVITEAEPVDEPGPRILFVNEAFVRRTGYAREEVIGRSPRFLQGPKTSRAELDRIRQAMLQWQPVRSELINYTRSGEEFWIEMDLVPITDEAGRFTHWVAVERDVTERRRAEEALRARGEILQAIFDHIPVMIGFIEKTGWIRLVNREFERVFGWTLEEMQNHPDIFAEWYPDPAYRAYVGAFIGEATGKFAEFQSRVRDGRVITTSFANVLLGDGTSIGIGLDITERKAVEEARKSSETRYRALFENAPDGILIADPESHYLDANESMCRMLGYTREELIGLHAGDIVAEAQIPEVAAAVAEVNTHHEHHREWQFRRKDGSLFSADVIAKKMPDGNLFGMVRDITERKRTEARFRRLIDSNAQGVVFWNKDGEITEANNAFLKIVGYEREDLEQGMVNWQAMTPPDYADLDQAALREIAVVGFCAPFEKVYLRKDGSQVPVLLGAAAFEDNPEEGVAYIVDLTERKRFEQQFLRAQRMESIGTLAGGIAHDLNNVLGPILLSIDMLQMRFTDTSSHELLSIIASSARRGADMVSQVLSFARGLEGQRVPVQIRHLVRDVEKLANETFPKHIRVKTTVPMDLWTVLGDPTQLHQVVLNLCVNARDAMPNGGSLTISGENLVIDAQYAAMHLEAKPGPYAVVQVEDTGIGMAPGILEKIFDPFFTTKEIGQGTGLGLSTSLAIVKSHGGFIRVQSDLGKGARFRLYLPAVAEDAEVSEQAVPTEMPRGQDQLILVVDDEAAVRMITKQTLEAFGYRVIVAADGAEAVALYATAGRDIAVVLTDMMMPLMDGPATIQVLRRMNPAIRIIGASGHSAKGHVAQAASLGVKHFLPKPYTAETLLKALRDILADQ